MNPVICLFILSVPISSMPIHGTKNSEGSSRDLTEDIRRVLQKRLDLATKHYEEIKKELNNDEVNKLKGEEGLSEKEKKLLYKTLLDNEKDIKRLKIELKDIKTVDKEQKGKDEGGSKDSSKGESESKSEEAKEKENVEGAVGREQKEEDEKSEENLEPLTEQILAGLKILEDMLNEDENKVLEEKEVGISLLMEEESASEREKFMIEQDKLLVEQERKRREEIEKLIEEDDDYFYTTDNYVSLVEKMNMLYGYPREGTSKRGRRPGKDKGEYWRGFKEKWRREEAKSNLRVEEGSSNLRVEEAKSNLRGEEGSSNMMESTEQEQDDGREEEMSTPKLEISDLSSDESMKNHFSYVPDEERSSYNSDRDKYRDLRDYETEETEDSSEEEYWTANYRKRMAKKARVDRENKDTGRIEPINNSSSKCGSKGERSKRDRNDVKMEVIEVEEIKESDKMGKNGGLSSEKDKIKVDGEGKLQERMKTLVLLGKERLDLIMEKNNRELHIEWINVGLNRGAFRESLQEYFVRTIKEIEEGNKIMERRIREIEIEENKLRSELQIIYPYGDPVIVDGGDQTVSEVVEVQEVIVIE
ncbi:hypothetical protein MACK_001055 [Theileria orientalis]|uniref:Uncharacterized protein n=1 Tax=Theileria orientalis TaxID=68886 RepID=A0A976QT65_THEOR|nr:hypothetical protein MACK_001055 [Theileria orientalis]